MSFLKCGSTGSNKRESRGSGFTKSNSFNHSSLNKGEHMSLLKMKLKAAVLMGIAGVLLFAGGAWAADAVNITSVTVTKMIRTSTGVKFTLVEIAGSDGTVGDVRYKIVASTASAPTLPSDFSAEANKVAGTAEATSFAVTASLTAATSYNIYFAWPAAGKTWATVDASTAADVVISNGDFIPPGVTSISVEAVDANNIIAGVAGAKVYNLSFTNFTWNIDVSSLNASGLGLPSGTTLTGIAWTNSAVTLTESPEKSGIFGGTATLTATAAGASHTTASTALTVTAEGVTSNSLTFTIGTRPALTGFKVTATSGNNYITVGYTLELTATAVPEDADGRSPDWSSSNTDVATVKNGTVTGAAAGTATITVSKKWNVRVVHGLRKRQ